MTSQKLLIGLVAVALCATQHSVRAEEITPTQAEQAFNKLANRYAPSQPVQQVAYVMTPAQSYPAPLPAPTPANPTIIPPASGPMMYPVPADSSGPLGSTCDDCGCPPVEMCRTSTWTAAIEFIPVSTHITNSEFGRWSDDDERGVALRFVLGYEDPTGYGFRARFSGLDNQASPQFEDVELQLSNFNLDVYKRVYFNRSDIAFGGGPASGRIDFLLDDDSHSEFEGGGVSMFLEGFYSIREFDHSDLGVVGRARYSLVFGDWRDTTGSVIPSTDNDTMSIVELAWGLEYRHRFGTCNDHEWFLGLLFEYQQWESDWMTTFADTSIGLSGVNINTGLRW